MKHNNNRTTRPQKIKKALYDLFSIFFINKSKIKKNMTHTIETESPFSISRHIRPISKKWGFDRGLPIDRYYIEKFLNEKDPEKCTECGSA